MCSRSRIRTLHDLVHDVEDHEGAEEVHRLCLRLMELAGMEHETTEATLDGQYDAVLADFPGTLDLGKAAVLIADGLDINGSGQHHRIAVTTDALPEQARLLLEQNLRPHTVTWSEGLPREPYTDLYRLYLVKDETPEVKSPLADSEVAIGEHIALSRIGNFGYVEFPCAVQPLVGGTRLQIHKDADAIRLFAYHGADVTEEARYVPVMNVFSGQNIPDQAIIDCVYNERQKRVLLLECISWNGELTYELPLPERLERLSRLRRGNEVQVSPHQLVRTPYEFAALKSNVVIKSPTASFSWPDHGWVVGKVKHIQPGRAVPYQRVSATPMTKHIATAHRAEGVMMQLGLGMTSDVGMIAQRVPVDAAWMQIHCCGNTVYPFTETIGSPVTLDIEHTECYSPLSEEGHDWVINAFRTSDGRIVATDCLEEDGTSLHAVALSTRLRVLRGKLGNRLDALTIEYDLLTGVEDLRQAIDALPDGYGLTVRRADTVYTLPDNPIEVDVTKT